MNLYLDFETRNHHDIDEIGLDNYARTAEVLMLGWAINDGPAQLWEPPASYPLELQEALLDDSIKIAWNAGFERAIFRQVHKMDIPIPEWRDPSVLARSLSMPGGLDSVCEILNIPQEEAKIKDGKRLLNLFSSPSGKGGTETLFGVEPDFYDQHSHPDDWQKLKEYCIRDVEIERKLWKMFQPLSFPEEQWEDWFLSEEINEEGIPVNVERAKKALRLAERFKTESRKRLDELTGLANTNSRDQLLPWLQARGYERNSIGKGEVIFQLGHPKSKLTKEAREVLELRQKSSQTSYTKLEQIVNQISPDGRLKHQFVFMGAARTGRYSAYGAQVMNLPRPIKEVEKADPEHIFDLIDREAYEEILKEFGGSTLPFVASVIRMLFSI